MKGNGETFRKGCMAVRSSHSWAAQSHFLSPAADLPIEIRLQIYDHLITTFSWGSAIHIFLTSQPNPLYPPSLGSGKLTYNPCTCPTQSPSYLRSFATSLVKPKYCTPGKRCKGWHSRN
ncbi:hypothetical protein NA56DRAFT_72578 [Hyaloscypha hepaticicola]|uniref:Uncharacterized protein n=1 Tax=Hyaloscypha hepaticicola TaxID=2082293 RepID=A0A2J6QB56_9HELO|nr:hypothetical protein NA56DRAFT_72578 [Hyaloscypha hepaticicola]